MSMIKCTECGNEISDKAASCPHCGCPMDEIKKEVAVGNKKKVIIPICAIAVLILAVSVWFLTVKLPNDKAMQEYVAVVEAYNVEVKGYNDIVDEYNVKIDEIISANSKLESSISSANKVLAEGNTPYDKSTVDRITEAVEDAEGKKTNVPEIKDYELELEAESIIAETDDVKSASALVNEKLVMIKDSIQNIENENRQLALPDYQKMIEEIEDAIKQYETSCIIQNQITYPTQEFVVGKIEALDNVSVIACVSEDNDPNGKLGTEGGYTAQIFFSSALLKTEDISTDELFDIGTDAGGSIEVYATVEDAVARNDYLASFDGLEYDTGKHTVLGTMVVRVSTNLTTTKQDMLSDELIEALTTP